METALVHQAQGLVSCDAELAHWKCKWDARGKRCVPGLVKSLHLVPL